MTNQTSFFVTLKNRGLVTVTGPDAAAFLQNLVTNDIALLEKQPSLYTCPECHGVLFQIEEGQIVRYRCHTGHAYSQEALLSEVDATIELGLWNAVRTMDEAILLLRQMADQANQEDDANRAQRMRTKADEIEQRSQQIRQSALNHEYGNAQDNALLARA